MSEKRQFWAFGDESGTFNRRYQSVSLVTGPSNMIVTVRRELRKVLAREQVAEVKFQKVGTHAPLLNAARAFQTLAVECAASRSIRVDTVIWDTRDSRHAVRRRDDSANLERMYYRVLVCAARHWGAERWSLRPDTGSQVDWAELGEVLNRTRLQRKTGTFPLSDEFSGGPTIIVESIAPTDSASEPLVQLADLFAGLARFSREEGDACVGWLATFGKQQEGQLGLAWDVDAKDATAAQRNRFLLVGTLRSACGRNRLGVSLSQRHCLWTPNGANPINFWHYTPQNAYDRAPRR